jgi:hypothetical protein
MVSTLPAGLPELTLGWGVIDWSDEWLIQPDGDFAGDRWVWSTSQVRFIAWYYALDEDGNYLYRRAAMRWAKGRGKSPALAALSLVELCGPVRFDYFDDTVPGGAVGRPHPMPWVQIAATAESQTVNTMSLISAMAPKNGPLAKRYHLDVGKTLIYKPGGGRLEVITASARAVEGARPTFVVMDEVQEWVDMNGGHALARAIRRNLAKLDGRSIEAGNAHIPGEDTVSEKTLAAWQLQQEGRTRGGGILYDSVEAPPDTDMADEASLRAGLQVAYSDAPWVNMDRIVAEIYDPSTPPDVSRRYYLNQVVATEDAWVTPQQWEMLAAPGQVVEDGADVVLFFDGSKTRDATALVGCDMATGHVFTVDVWEPHDREPVPTASIDAAVDMAFERWRVVAFFADVQEWQGFTKVTWPERYGADLLVWASSRGTEPQAIAWDMRTKLFDFTMAAETTHAEIVEKKFTHDGDSRLARHVINTRNRPNRYGMGIAKETRDSPRKIDAAVCMVGARMVRRLVLAAPEWKNGNRAPLDPTIAVFHR